MVSAYRRAIDSYTAAPGGYRCPAETLKELEKSSHRRYSPGFYLGEEKALQNTQSAQYLRGCEVTAVVERWKDDVAWCTQRGRYRLGEPLEALLPNGENVALAPSWLYDAEKQSYTQETPRAMMRFLLPVSQPLPPGTILRRPLQS